MKIPEGYKEVYGELNDTALLLIMASYGLVQEMVPKIIRSTDYKNELHA